MTVENFIYSCSNDSLKSKKTRARLANNLQKVTDYWNLQEIKEFVEEMRGLNFYNLEDKKIFCEFFLSFYGGSYESSRT